MGILGLNLTRITAKMKIWNILILVAFLVAVHCEKEDVEEKDVNESLVSDEDEEIITPEEATEVEETEESDEEMQKRGSCSGSKRICKLIKIRWRRGKWARGTRCATCRWYRRRGRCYRSCGTWKKAGRR